jgi:hypothetical protein
MCPAGPGRERVGAINWCFGGVAMVVAVVRRVLDVGGVVRYVSSLILSLERTYLLTYACFWGVH